MLPLFREDAVKHAGRRLSGEVLLQSSPAFAVLSWALVCAVAIFAIGLATASYTRQETVKGWLAPTGGLIRLTARQSGSLEHLYVREGQSVQAGDPIATVRLSTSLPNGDASRETLLSLERQSSAAAARARTDRLSLEAEGLGLTNRRRIMMAELVELNRSRELQMERIGIAERDVAQAEALLSQGYLPRRDVEARKSNALALQQSLAETDISILSARRQIAEASERLAAIPLEIARLEAEAQTSTADIDLRRTQAEISASYVVVAPRAARVAALPLHEGQEAPATSTIAILRPDNAELEAELFVPSAAAGFVRVGQPVRLMYAAFPHDRFGPGRGVVTSISGTLIGPDDLNAPGITLTQPVFRVRVKLDEQTISAYGRPEALQAGMLLDARIVLGRRSLWQWLMDPLYALGGRGR